MTDTPRTNAMEKQLAATDCCFLIEPEFPALIEFARKLERLEKYARHSINCDTRYYTDGTVGKCDCGLDALLAALDAKPPTTE